MDKPALVPSRVQSTCATVHNQIVTSIHINKKCSHNEINVQLKQKELKFAIKTGRNDISLPAVIIFWVVEIVGKLNLV